MGRKKCEICGHARNSGDLVIHEIVPEEVVARAGMSDLKTAVLCVDCRNELQAWYNQKVFRVSYREKVKRFVPMTPAELAKEYQAAYEAFAARKK
ncbi:MAG: hypothetical protein V3V23_07665 [Dehalococcoidales bacterium]